MATIESIIKQTKPFSDEWTRALVNMIYTGNLVSDHINQVLSQYGISSKQFNVLRIVNGADENVSTAYIRERLLVKSADSSRLVDRMVKKGLLIKKPFCDDARKISIELSKQGKSLLKKVSSVSAGKTSPLQNLSKSEVLQLNSILNKIR